VPPAPPVTPPRPSTSAADGLSLTIHQTPAFSSIPDQHSLSESVSQDRSMMMSGSAGTTQPQPSTSASGVLSSSIHQTPASSSVHQTLDQQAASVPQNRTVVTSRMRMSGSAVIVVSGMWYPCLYLLSWPR